MDRRVDALREVGIDIENQSRAASYMLNSEFGEFSGYGQFTPITILSYTVKKDADLERNQSRS